MDPIALLNQAPAAASAKSTGVKAKSEVSNATLPISEEARQEYDPDLPEQSLPELEAVLSEEMGEALILPDQASTSTPAILRPMSHFAQALPLTEDGNVPIAAVATIVDGAEGLQEQQAAPTSETTTDLPAPLIDPEPAPLQAGEKIEAPAMAQLKAQEPGRATEASPAAPAQNMAAEEIVPTLLVETPTVADQDTPIPADPKPKDISPSVIAVPVVDRAALRGSAKPEAEPKPTVSTGPVQPTASVAAPEALASKSVDLREGGPQSAPVSPRAEAVQPSLTQSTPPPTNPISAPSPILMSAPQTSVTDMQQRMIEPAMPLEITDVEAMDPLRTERGLERSISQTTSVRATQQATIITQQIAAAVSKTPEGSIDIRLDPPELGRVTLKMSLTEAGATALVSADRPEVVDLLRRNEAQLAREMKEAGLGEMSFAFAEQNPGEQKDREASQAFAMHGGTTANEQDAAIAMAQDRAIQLDHLDIRL